MQFKVCHTLKRHIRMLLLPPALTLACAATAQAQSNYGCTVLLCLANPAGPTAAPACVPSITQLWWDLSHFRGFPSCVMAGNAATHTGSYALQRSDPYLDCPTGSSMLPSGSYSQGIGTSQGQLDYAAAAGFMATSVGDPNTIFVNPGDPIPLKTCGGNYQGQGAYWDSNYGWTTRPIYGTLTQVGLATTPNIVDVYLNGTISKSIRW